MKFSIKGIRCNGPFNLQHGDLVVSPGLLVEQSRHWTNEIRRYYEVT